MSSATPLPTSSEIEVIKKMETVRHLKQMGLIKRLTGLLGYSALEDGHDESMENRRAESRAARRLWGKDRVADEADDMRQNILGDVTITNPSPPPSTPSALPKLLGPLLIASGLSGGLVGAGLIVADAVKSRPVSSIEDTDTDTTTVIELE